MRRKDETKRGPAFGRTSFIATIAVPQKKNGEIKTPHSHSSFAAIGREEGAVSGSSFFLRRNSSPASESEELPGTRHSTSCPVPTQSMEEDSSCTFLPVQLMIIPGNLLRVPRNGGVCRGSRRIGVLWLLRFTREPLCSDRGTETEPSGASLQETMLQSISSDSCLSYTVPSSPLVTSAAGGREWTRRDSDFTDTACGGS